MKLRNKKTRIIGELHFEPDKEYHFTVATEDPADMMIYKKLAGLYAEWEDYEDPKDNDYWYIDDFGRVQFSSEILDEVEEHPNNWMTRKLFGNYFGTREEAEQVLEKLKAWKRLKDKGFRLDAVVDKFFCLDIFMRGESYEAIKDDLKIVFGGENESNN